MRANKDKKTCYSNKQLEEVAKNVERFVTAQLRKDWSYMEFLKLITTGLLEVRTKRQTKRGNQQGQGSRAGHKRVPESFEGPQKK